MLVLDVVHWCLMETNGAANYTGEYWCFVLDEVSWCLVIGKNVGVLWRIPECFHKFWCLKEYLGAQ